MLKSSKVSLYVIFVGLVFGTFSTQVAAEKSVSQVASLQELPRIKDMSKRKKRFAEILLPVIKSENDTIRGLRQHVIELRNKAKQAKHSLTRKDIRWLKNMAVDYRVKEGIRHPDFFSRLLRKVDILPPSLIIAQGALESAWGTSRFAQQGNNLFGLWCLKKGCGLVPSRRLTNARHEVARFDSLNEGVRAYMLNLNRKVTYVSLRNKRWAMRQHAGKERLSGLELAVELHNYSQIGKPYVSRIQTLIRRNNLDRLDRT